ncbi:hypothetical protein [Streptosporangium sp. H16]
MNGSVIAPLAAVLVVAGAPVVSASARPGIAVFGALTRPLLS